MTKQEEIAIHDLVEAVWQVLDDMGKDGNSCCTYAKAQLRIAYEPFRDASWEDWMSLARAKAIINEVTTAIV